MASATFSGPKAGKRGKASDSGDVLLPHDIEAEQALLGSLLIDRDALADVRAEIPNFNARHFYNDTNRMIYTAIGECGTDPVAVAGYLKDHGVKDASFVLHELMQLESVAYAVSAARRVYNMARRRAQIGLAQSILTAGWNGDDAAFEQALEKAERLKEDYIPPKARSLKVRSLIEIMATDYPEVRMLLEKVIQQGVVTLLAGKAKAGKSFLLLAAAFAIAEACQHAFRSLDKDGNILYHGLHCQQSDVLYLALEDTERRLKNRSKKMRGDLPIPEGIDVATEAPRIDEGVIEQLEMYLDEHPNCHLIMIDTLTSVLPPPKNGGSYLEDRLNMEGLRQLAHRRDVAILPIIHCRKADGSDVFDTIQTTMGSQAGAENLVVLQRRRGEDRAILHVTGNDLEEEALALKWNKDTCTWAILGDAEQVAENEQEQLIFDALEALGGEGRLGKIAEILKSEMAFAQVRTMLYRMSEVKPGAVVKNKLVNTGGVFRRNEEFKSENSENSENCENSEKHENHTGNQDSRSSHEDFADFSPFSDFSEFSTFSKVDQNEGTEEEAVPDQAAAFINADDLIDANVVTEVETRIEQELKVDALALWEKHNWRGVMVDGALRGGGSFTAKKCIENAVGSFLRALMIALAALGV